MPGRGPQTFKKRQKEQERRERQQEKMAKRLQRKADKASGVLPVEDDIAPFPQDDEDTAGDFAPTAPFSQGHHN